jgi:hypothetical protein
MASGKLNAYATKPLAILAYLEATLAECVVILEVSHRSGHGDGLEGIKLIAICIAPVLPAVALISAHRRIQAELNSSSVMAGPLLLLSGQLNSCVAISYAAILVVASGLGIWGLR